MDALTLIALMAFIAALLADRQLSRRERERLQDSHSADAAHMQALAAAERRELANRIQHPHLVPVAARPRPAGDDGGPHRHAMANVGTARPMQNGPPPHEPEAG